MRVTFVRSVLLFWGIGVTGMLVVLFIHEFGLTGPSAQFVAASGALVVFLYSLPVAKTLNGTFFTGNIGLAPDGWQGWAVSLAFYALLALALAVLKESIVLLGRNDRWRGRS